MCLRLVFCFLIFTPLLFVLSHGTCYSQGTYILKDTSIVHRLDAHVQVLIDNTDSLSIEEVTSPAFQSQFQPNEGTLNFGYQESAIWIKLQVQTTSPTAKWYLEIPAPFLEHVDFYQSQDSHTWRHSQSGYYQKHSQRELSHTGHVLPLQFPSNALATVYMRIAGSSPKTFPLYAIENEKFVEKTRFEDLGYGILFGTLIVMFFYNLFIYSILRQETFLYYFCTIICTFFIFAAISGYGGKFLWPETPMMNYIMGKLTLEALVILLAIFTIRFLDVKKYSSVMYYLLLALIPLAVLSWILVIAQIFPYAGSSLISLSTLLFTATGIVVRVQGNKTANYFIAAWTVYFAGGLLLTIRNSGLLDYNFWTTHFVEVGAILQTTIIGFALGDQYRKYKKEKEQAQMLALKVQQEATSKLELKVRERTEELSNANEHLQLSLETNRRQTRIIENKNAELDAFFYRISHDLKGPITSSLGLIHLAKLELKDEKALEFVDKQHSQLERLGNIIRGLVKLTKLHDTYLQREKIDFHKITDDCISSFYSLANYPKVTFIKEIQQDIEFYSEWTLLNAILQNLIENSIKYAAETEPYVKIMVREESGWLTIMVEDNGQGIGSEHQSRIFELFYRASHSENGSGLGLYILKRSVDRLEGTIDIKSDIGKGSMFIVRLPSNVVQAKN